uniref:Ig-like domain-containing protein n=1 Tax=Oryzias latipes TaxID=8090 RepID=A0A3P9LLA1_ORYLA
GVKAAPSEAAVPATAAPIKRLDNLFFIEEPTNVSQIRSAQSLGPSPPEEPIKFALKPVPLKFTKKLKDIVLQEAESIGSSAVFECEVSPSTAITSWMKDGTNLRESPKHKFTSDGKDRKLNIIDVQLSDTGEYTCVAKNAGKEISCTAKLIVEGKPQLLSNLKAGSKIELPADVKGKPDPRVKWTKADLVLRADDRVAIDCQPGHSKLSISNTTRGDTATYIIEAVNICGRATATIDVNILGTELISWHNLYSSALRHLKNALYLTYWTVWGSKHSSKAWIS